MVRLGARVRLYADEIGVDLGDVPYTAGQPRILNRFRHPFLQGYFHRAVQKRFVCDLRPNDIAWIWPNCDVATYQAVRDKGIPIVMELINTRMATAARILEPEFARERLENSTGITPASIAEEEEMLSTATAVFAPSPTVRASVLAHDSAFRGTVIDTGYGAHRPDDARLAALKAAAPKREKPVVLFAGSLIVRKGVHLLLRAWARADPDATLLLCGQLHPDIAQICAQELALPSVQQLGFVKDMPAVYASADAFVMPSLEEGGPQVTFEAAAHGLPLLVSRMGGNALWERGEDVIRIEPHDTEGFAAALTRIVTDAGLRERLGARARHLTVPYDWTALAASRIKSLRETFPDRDFMA